MTHEFWRHVQPDRTLVIDLGERGRGPAVRERYEGGPGEVTWQEGYNDAISPETIRAFCDGLDVIYCAETYYRDDFIEHAHAVGARVVLHTMPELHRADLPAPDALWTPTPWELERLPAGARIVPVPVPGEYRPPAEEPDRTVLFHPSAPAMNDRNGTELVEAALRHVQHPVTVILTDGKTAARIPPHSRYGARISVDVRPPVEDRRHGYPADAGTLLLPRRYAGLSLPMQEAAGLGWHIITLDLPPQNEWVHRAGRVLATPGPEVRMGGGWFMVWGCQPLHLAAAIDRVHDMPLDVCEASDQHRAHAEMLSWTRWTAKYRELLESSTQV